VPQIVVSDNLKSGVTKPCRYDLDVNPAYQQLASHTVWQLCLPDPISQRIKPKAEVAVEIIERWILARLRHHTFFSLGEPNTCIKALLVKVNHKPFKHPYST